LSIAETQHSENFAKSHGCCNLPDAEVLITRQEGKFRGDLGGFYHGH
jgi:hypothetical protein